jgi:isopentenyldiphosphate isomerase
MEYYDSLKIKAEWGNNPCTHPFLEKEYYSGAFLITYVCTRCGSEFTIAQKMEIDAERKNSAMRFASTAKEGIIQQG